MPMTAEQAIFPGGYRVFDIVIACCLATTRHTGGIEEGQTVRASFEKYLRTLVDEHPEMPLPVLMANAYTITLHDYQRERFEWLGEPLRATWFELTYESWFLMAQRAGRIRATQIEHDRALARVLALLAELGVEASADVCLAEIDRFVPMATARFTEGNRDVFFAAPAFVKAMRYAHLAALRHRRRISPGFIEAGVLIAAEDPPGPIARDIASYLRAHGIFAGKDPAEVQSGDRLLAILSDATVAAPAFWGAVEAGLGLGLRPLVFTLFPRTAIDELGTRVPVAHRAAFSWLSESTVVEFGDGVQRFIPLLRALDSVEARCWWWRDDAIDIGTALNIFELFDRSGPAPRRSGGIGTAPYPLPPAPAAVTLGLDVGGRFTFASEEAWLASYEAAADALVPLRADFPDGHYRLPWFVVACWTRVLLAAREEGAILPRRIEERAHREMQLGLFSLGMGSSPGQVDHMLSAIADLPWPASTTRHDRVMQLAHAFIAMVRHLGDAAVARSRRVGLAIPLRSAFLSYARADEPVARRLVTYVEAKNVADVWWDMNSITMGSVLDRTLRGAIEGAECVLLLVSPASIASRYVRIELDCALGAGLDIVPILLGAEPGASVAAAFGYADAAKNFRPPLRIDPADEEGSFRNVGAALARDAEAMVHWLTALLEP